jgi:trans-2,3-dihydro-3-hydroxyanthranilate isomerase
LNRRFVLADVFTTTPFAGNRLAVFPDAVGLSAQSMQAVAREFNFPETTFLVPSTDPRHAARVRIFTPKSEVAFAGHPTIGTAAVLAELGHVQFTDGVSDLTLEECVGPVSVNLRAGSCPGSWFASLTLAAHLDRSDVVPERTAVAASLSLSDAALSDVWFASVGLPFCFVRLAGREDVDGAALNREHWLSTFSQAWCANLFVFAGTLNSGSQLYARMFAPGLGIDEDPATGSACAALAASLAMRRGERDGEFHCKIEQGVALGRPSFIYAAATRRHGKLLHVRVAGHAVVIGHGELRIQSRRDAWSSVADSDLGVVPRTPDRQRDEAGRLRFSDACPNGHRMDSHVRPPPPLPGDQ